MSDLYDNLLKATDNTNDITNEKYGTITKINDNLASVKEENSDIEHSNVPMLSKVPVETGDKVIIGFVDNSIYNPVIIGNLSRGVLDSVEHPCALEVLNENLILDFCNEKGHGGEVTGEKPSTDIIENFALNNLGIESGANQSEINQAINTKIGQGGGGSVIVDDELSTTSTNPVENRIITDALNNKADTSHNHTKSEIVDFPDLSAVATSGDYNDLSNKPAIPSKTSDLTNDGDGTNVFVKNNDSRLSDARIPTSHTHTKSEISDFPTIPSKLSDLTNDSDFIEKSNTSGLIKNDGTIDTTSYSTFSGAYNDLTGKPSIPSKTSDLTNDGDGINAFLTQHQSLTNYVQKSSTNGLIKNDGTIDTTQYLSSLPSHNHDDRYYTESEMDTALGNKQDNLVSGTNIKTINNQSLLGQGNITIQGGGTVTVDDSLSTTSTNPVQNKIITTALNGKAESSSLSTVATSGSYNDLSSKPTIPSKISDLVNDSDFIETSSTTGLIKNDGTIDTTSYYSNISVSTGVDTSNEVLYIDITLS